MSTVPSTSTVLSTLTRVTWKRLFRGRAFFICCGIAGLPAMAAAPLHGNRDAVPGLVLIQLVVTALLSSVFVAASLGEDIEERTITYLWSRPLPRWTIIVSKVLALAPISLGLSLAGWFLAVQVATDKPPELQWIASVAADAVVSSMVAAGIATIVPRQGMALAIIYLVVLDVAIGVLPASIHEIAVSYQVVSLGGFDKQDTSPVHAAIALAIIGAVWMTIGILRIRRLET